MEETIFGLKPTTFDAEIQQTFAADHCAVKPINCPPREPGYFDAYREFINATSGVTPWLTGAPARPQADFAKEWGLPAGTLVTYSEINRRYAVIAPGGVTVFVGVPSPLERLPEVLQKALASAAAESIAGAFITFTCIDCGREIERRRTATDTGDAVGRCDACKNRNPEDPIDHPELPPIATARLKYLEKA